MAVRRSDRSPSFPLSSASSQLVPMTPRTAREILRYAQHRVGRLCEAGVPVSSTYDRELVDDARADTSIGRRPWNPGRCNLLQHLGMIIKKRTWLDLRRVYRFPIVRLEFAANDSEPPSEIEEAFEQAETARNTNRAQLSAALSVVCQHLRHLVDHEHQVTALTQCWEAGVVESREILACTGLSRGEYERARKRAMYASRQLPEELSDALREMLRQAA
jgi:hypothetical protein